MPGFGVIGALRGAIKNAAGGGEGGGGNAPAPPSAGW